MGKFCSCIVLWIMAWGTIPCVSLAQLRPAGAFGDHLLIGTHYGASIDFVNDPKSLYEIEQFWGLRAAITVAPQFYVGIQTRRIWAKNFETPTQVFYMAGVFGRAYFLPPVWSDKGTRLGVFVETGFMKGNYAYFYKNQANIRYYKEDADQWYIPCLLGFEYRLVRNFTLQAAIHTYYNNGGSWDEQGIAYPSVGINWHGW